MRIVSASYEDDMDAAAARSATHSHRIALSIGTP
jgi:hypothetical protein